MTRDLAGGWGDELEPVGEGASGAAPVVRVRVLTRGLALGLLALGAWAMVASERWESPGRVGASARSSLTAGGGAVSTLVFSEDGRSLAATAGDLVNFWGAASRRKVMEIATRSGPVRSAFAPDGRTFATANCGPIVMLWDVESGAGRATLEVPGRRFVALAFAPDGRTLAAADVDGGVTLWETATARVRDAWRDHECGVSVLVFAPDGRTLASGRRGGDIVLRDLERKQTRARFRAHTSNIQEVRGGVASLAFSADGRILASAGFNDSVVRLWDASGARLIASYEAHPGSATFVAFPPGGRTLLSAGLDGRVIAWNLETGRPRVLLTGLGRFFLKVALAPDGRTLATAEGESISLWSLNPEATIPPRPPASPPSRG